MAESSVPDVYADQFNVALNIWGVALGFGARPIEPVEDDKPVKAAPKVIVRMGHGHAKVTAILLRKVLKQYEAKHGEVTIPPNVLEALDISLAEW